MKSQADASERHLALSTAANLRFQKEVVDLRTDKASLARQMPLLQQQLTAAHQALVSGAAREALLQQQLTTTRQELSQSTAAAIRLRTELDSRSAVADEVASSQAELTRLRAETAQLRRALADSTEAEGTAAAAADSMRAELRASREAAVHSPASPPGAAATPDSLAVALPDSSWSFSWATETQHAVADASAAILRAPDAAGTVVTSETEASIQADSPHAHMPPPQRMDAWDSSAAPENEGIKQPPLLIGGSESGGEDVNASAQPAEPSSMDGGWGDSHTGAEEVVVPAATVEDTIVQVDTAALPSLKPEMIHGYQPRDPAVPVSQPETAAAASSTDDVVLIEHSLVPPSATPLPAPAEQDAVEIVHGSSAPVQLETQPAAQPEDAEAWAESSPTPTPLGDSAASAADVQAPAAGADAERATGDTDAPAAGEGRAAQPGRRQASNAVQWAATAVVVTGVLCCAPVFVGHFALRRLGRRFGRR